MVADHAPAPQFLLEARAGVRRARGRQDRDPDGRRDGAPAEGAFQKPLGRAAVDRHEPHRGVGLEPARDVDEDRVADRVVHGPLLAAGVDRVPERDPALVQGGDPLPVRQRPRDAEEPLDDRPEVVLRVRVVGPLAPRDHAREGPEHEHGRVGPGLEPEPREHAVPSPGRLGHPHRVSGCGVGGSGTIGSGGGGWGWGPGWAPAAASASGRRRVGGAGSGSGWDLPGCTDLIRHPIVLDRYKGALRVTGGSAACARRGCRSARTRRSPRGSRTPQRSTFRMPLEIRSRTEDSSVCMTRASSPIV